MLLYKIQNSLNHKKIKLRNQKTNDFSSIICVCGGVQLLWVCWLRQTFFYRLTIYELIS